MTGLLDFDDDEIMRSSGLINRPKRSMRRESEIEFEDRFAELQNLGHKENSKDFEDSAFADRAPLQHEEDPNRQA